MDEITVIRSPAPPDDPTLPQLLLSLAGIEIARQRMAPDAAIWISPADNPATVEYFYLLSGSISLMTQPETRLAPGDSFCVRALGKDVPVRAHCDSELLYFSTGLSYESSDRFHREIDALNEQIDRKDRHTRLHSRRVMLLSTKLYQQLKPADLRMDDIVAAALFHDVGKCRVPDDVLKKPTRYTPDEYLLMKRHPVDSDEILRPRYTAAVADIARWHHERMDGSGYPDRLSGEDIPLGARILAVADSFEAMTANRPYAARKTFFEALYDLRVHAQQYDQRIVDALERILHAETDLYGEGTVEA